MALSEKMMPFLYINITNIKKIKKNCLKNFSFSKKFCIFALENEKQQYLLNKK